MKEEEVREAIITAVRENFTVENEDFVDNGFIERSTDFNENGNYHLHSEFAAKLAEVLNKVFPDHPRRIMVDNCDSIEDIIRNNFKFN